LPNLRKATRLAPSPRHWWLRAHAVHCPIDVSRCFRF